MFAERLNELRKNKGLNQPELAKELNVAKQTVSNWENNNRTPDNEMLIKIANYFDVSLDYLLGRTDNPNYSVLSTNYKGNNVEIVINSKTNNYSQEQIQTLFDKLSSIGINVDDLIEEKK